MLLLVDSMLLVRFRSLDLDFPSFKGFRSFEVMLEDVLVPRLWPIDPKEDPKGLTGELVSPSVEWIDPGIFIGGEPDGPAPSLHPSVSTSGPSLVLIWTLSGSSSSQISLPVLYRRGLRGSGKGAKRMRGASAVESCP
jgi:hypothetical protein